MRDDIHQPLAGRWTGLSRREFVKYLVAGSALSVGALGELNAGIYQSIKSLNQQLIENEAPDGAYWDAVGKHFLFEDDLIMMNNGTVGPMPRPVFNSVVRAFRLQVSNPFDVYNYLPRMREDVRRRVAEFVGASPDEIALTANTTEGINFVAGGLDLKEGDEVLISDMEHPAGTHPWRLKEKRYGISVRQVSLGLPPRSVDEFVGGFEKAVSVRTRVISVSHTVYLSGLIAPLKELSRMARDKGILVVADSAHGIGMLDLDLHDLGVDFFATSPYKWLGAPTGVGVLYVRKEVQDRVWPTVASSGWDTDKSARRFETLGQRSDALVVGLGEALDFQNRIGKSRIERRIKALSGYLKRELKKIPGVRLHTSEDPYLSGGLTVFSAVGLDPARVVDYVREKHNLVVRTVGSTDKGTYGVRVSTPIYVGFDHVDMFLEGVRNLVRLGL